MFFPLLIVANLLLFRFKNSGIFRGGAFTILERLFLGGGTRSGLGGVGGTGFPNGFCIDDTFIKGRCIPEFGIL